MKLLYKKKLSNSDAGQKLSVPSEWVREGRLMAAPAAGSEAVPIQMKGDGGNDYTFMLTVRRAPRGDRKYYAKPEFRRREWRAYVAENSIEPGDTVYFWQDTRGFIRLRAHVPPRPYKLFGVSFLY